MDSDEIARLKSYLINKDEKLKSQLDKLIEILIFKTNNDVYYNNIRSIILKKLDEILEAKINEINNGIKNKITIYPNIYLFIYGLQLYVIITKNKKHNYLFNTTCFNILLKYIPSNDIVVYVDEIIIDYLYLYEFEYLKDHEIFDYLNIKNKFILKNPNQDYKDIKIEIPGLSLEYENLRDFEIDKFKNIKNLDLSKNFLTSLEISSDLIYLDVSYNPELKSLQSKSKNALEYINITGTLLTLNDLLPFESLQTIIWNGDIYKDNNFEIIKQFKHLKTLLNKDNETLRSRDLKISDLNNLEHLSIKAHCNIKDDVGSLSSLTIRCYKCLRIECRNITSLYIEEYLSVYSNYDKLINFNNIKSCSSLTKLNIKFHMKNIKLLDLNPISNLKNLTSLTLSNIKLDSNSKFTGLDKLTELELNGVMDNKCFNYTEHIFSDLPSLKKLSITEGSLENKVFSRLPNLEELELKYITNIDLTEHLFTGLKLIKLSISESEFKHVSNSVFNSLNTLKFLYLYGLNINDIPIDIFSKLYSLTKLTLVLNNNFVPSNLSFNGLCSLKELNLTGSFKRSMGCIKEDFFYGLDELEVLCFYSSIPIDNKIFLCLQKLRILKLTIPSLYSISNDLFKHFKTLEYIKLLHRIDINEKELRENNPNLMYIYT